MVFDFLSWSLFQIVWCSELGSHKTEAHEPNVVRRKSFQEARAYYQPQLDRPRSTLVPSYTGTLVPSYMGTSVPTQTYLHHPNLHQLTSSSLWTKRPPERGFFFWRSNFVKVLSPAADLCNLGDNCNCIKFLVFSRHISGSPMHDWCMQ